MNNHETATSLVKQALAALKREIESPANRSVSVADIGQLVVFQTHFEEMLGQLERGNVPERDLRIFGIGHAISDSWPLNSKLGNLLCLAEQTYRNL